MDITEQVEILCREIQHRRGRVRWLLERAERLKEVPMISSSCVGSTIDFDNLKHAEVIKVIRSLGGKWRKSPGAKENTINYETEIGGVTVRCWQGDPPPSCRIIEVEEHVPEKVIPAHTVKKMVMKCHPEIGAVIATAAEKAVMP